MIVLILSIVCAIPLFILFVQWRWDKEDKRLGLSGPKCLPLIGNIHQIWKAAKENNSKFRKL